MALQLAKKGHHPLRKKHPTKNSDWLDSWPRFLWPVHLGSLCVYFWVWVMGLAARIRTSELVLVILRASLVAQMAKNLPAMGQEDSLEKEMATHSSIPAWEIPWTEESDGLQSMGSQRVGYNRYEPFYLSPKEKGVCVLKKGRVWGWHSLQGHCRWKGRTAGSGARAMLNLPPPACSLRSDTLQLVMDKASCLARVQPSLFVRNLDPLLAGGQLKGLVALAGPLPCWWFCT